MLSKFKVETQDDDDLKKRTAQVAALPNEQVIESYNAWADAYDKDMCPTTYKGPALAAKVIADFYVETGRKDKFKLLDVAAGTGRLGFELNKYGFKNMDAIEPSSGMMQVLTRLGIYGKIYDNIVNHQPIQNIADSEYDALTVVGAMGGGHIPSSGFQEFVRIVKPGGMIFIAGRINYFETTGREDADDLVPAMEALEKAGYWKKLSHIIVPEFSFQIDGVIFSYQVGSKF